MRISLKILLLLALILISSSKGFTQNCEKHKGVEITTERVADRNLENYQDWREVKTRKITLFIPDELKEIDGYCCEGDVAGFRGNSLSIRVDTKAQANYPMFVQTYRTYEEKSFCIDGKLAWFWSYKDDSRKDNFLAGVRIYLEENSRHRLAIYFYSKDENMKQIAEKIVKSIKFNEMK